VISAYAYTPARGVHPERMRSGFGALLDEPDTVLWLDLEQPTSGDLTLLQTEFGFHELAIEDVELPQQRPKVDYYDDHRFVVIYAVSRDNGALAPRELDLFVGERYVVTVHRDPMPDFDEVQQRWTQATTRMGGGLPALFYAILDATVDGYFPAIDVIAESVETLEESIIARTGDDGLTELFALKKQLIGLRRVLAPERDVLNGFLHREWPELSPSALTYFQDVYDHVVRVIDSLDVYQDLLSNALDISVSIASNQLNVVVKRLTAIATILAVPTIVFSLYGMNFANMPELHWEYGYPAAVLGTVAITALVAAVLRHRDWL
jgi:magnesium transporter